ncbi:ABC transporter substrate-binding protein [Candidatus Mesenet endosymbiont of Agriotes lineatus]|uniref:MlaC/ttg2D family ABC transporter substrate-binding protein n=1 Tax=Candidatus Mesenet endosymbiont of Agriotes lineatus TaxID=3077948 RepID=UPI0030CAF440
MNIRFLTKSSFIILMFLLIISNNCFAKQASSINQIEKPDVAEDLRRSRDFIRSLNYQINNISGESKEHDYQELRKIIKENIDIRKMAKFVMGKHWQLASEEEKEVFIKEYSTYLEHLYVSNLYKFKGNKVTVIGNQHLENNSYLVSTRLSNNNDFTNMSYKLRKSNDSFCITDITVDGININIIQRLKFEQKIEDHGLKNIIATLKQSNLNSNF